MVDDMAHVMVDDMAHVMVLFFLGRWEKFQVLHSDLRPDPTTPGVLKMLISWGFM
jgi:hypothetical protein